MSILETLQTDHRQVKELLKTILSTADAKKRSDLFKQFRTELTAHSRAEEKVTFHRRVHCYTGNPARRGERRMLLRAASIM